MSVHRRLLSILAQAVSRFDPTPAGPAHRLAGLRRDKDTARREIQRVLDRYAARHGIAPEVQRLSRAHVDLLVNDLFLDREEALDRETGQVPDISWALSSITSHPF